MLLWLGIVFFLSSQPYQKQSIQPFLQEHISSERASQLVPDVSFRYGESRIVGKESPYVLIEFVFRKSAHLFIYMVLSVLAAVGLKGIGGRVSGVIIGSLLIVLCAATADEWNQLHHAQRTGSVLDIGVDFAGGCLGIVVVLLYSIWRRKRAGRGKWLFS